MREDHVVEGALLAKSQQAKSCEKNNPSNNQINIVAKWVILHLDVGRDLMLHVSSAIKWNIKQSYARAKISSKNKKKKLRLLIKRRKINSLWPCVLQAVKRVRIG